MENVFLRCPRCKYSWKEKFDIAFMSRSCPNCKTNFEMLKEKHCQIGHVFNNIGQSSHRGGSHITVKQCMRCGCVENHTEYFE